MGQGRYFQAKAFYFTSPPYKQRQRKITYFEYKVLETMALSLPDKVLCPDDLSSSVLIPLAKINTSLPIYTNRPRGKDLKTAPKLETDLPFV